MAGLLGWAALALTGCRRAATEATAPVERVTIAHARQQTAESCRTCHVPVQAAWAGTDHALANRLMSKDAAAAGALATFPRDQVPAGESAESADAILGHAPLWQPLVPKPGGRWQPHELAYDPAKKEWFNVFGNEGRHAGEWGHWTGRGMNWNSMCAQCHMTGFEKNYDAATDTYHSSWVEQGVGCIQCHGPMADGHGQAGQPPLRAEQGGSGAAALTGGTGRAPPWSGDRSVMMQTCAPCHARNEPLTDAFQPGDLYHDHYRVSLPSEPGVFYPDGQQREEVFNWTSLLSSRMGHAGVTCLDCHDPHSNRVILPVANNALCLQCHAAPGKTLPSGVRAVPIDPVAHSHHGEGSVGNQCVSCHMPTTTYMQRAPRHDHGWLKPDPLLTKELGIPNACNRCHTDKPVEWAVAQTDAWYGAKMESRQRERARAVAAAQAGRPEAVDGLLKLLAGEEVPMWRASYLSLLAPHVETPAVVTAARRSLEAKDPLERAAAVRVLGPWQPARGELRPLLKDPSRLVRLDAAWALSPELAEGSPERAEYDRYLRLSLDQPSGRLRLGQDLANRGRLGEAEVELRRAAQWDPHSPGIQDAYGWVLSGLGRSFEAAASFYRAALMQPADAAVALRAALAYAESGHWAESETAFRLALQRDPKLDRAWYNLGLLLAQNERLPEAAEALSRAEALAPSSTEYPYALATVRLRQGDRAGATAAAQRVLQRDPQHRGAQQILGGR